MCLDGLFMNIRSFGPRLGYKPWSKIECGSLRSET